MTTVILFIHLMLAAALIAVVLLQRSEGGALGIGGGGGGFLTGRGTANLLTRTTAFLAAGFFATSLLLSIIASRGAATQGSVFEQKPAGQESGETYTPGPSEPGRGGILDKLRSQGAPTAPAAPPAPTGPVVPQSK
jgi:preprotein translocase subunit SecG